MKEIIGKKLGMTRLFADNGEAVPVTVVEAGPNVVIAKRTPEKDGYKAIQVGYGQKRKKTLEMKNVEFSLLYISD